MRKGVYKAAAAGKGGEGPGSRRAGEGPGGGTCSLQAVHAHEADDHHLEDEQVREEGAAALALLPVLTGQAQVGGRGQVEETEVEVLQDRLAERRQLCVHRAAGGQERKGGERRGPGQAGSPTGEGERQGPAQAGFCSVAPSPSGQSPLFARGRAAGRTSPEPVRETAREAELAGDPRRQRPAPAPPRLTGHRHPARPLTCSWAAAGSAGT